jgi:hypothetical protein
MTEQVKKTSYMPLWILIALCGFPYIGGTLYYQYLEQHPQSNTTNYGSLISPVKEVKNINLTMLDGSEKPITDYRKKWLMLYVLDRDCAEECQKNLYFMRQIRRAMSKDRFRINRLLVLDSKQLLTENLQKYLQDFEGMDVATISSESRNNFFSALQDASGNTFRKIMLIDPMGNFMMEYDSDPNPELVLKDVKRLLSISRIG